MSKFVASLSYDVIKYNIYPYLNIRDKLLLNLSGVKPLISINAEFNKCIRLRMHKLGFTEENVNELFKIMKADNAVISGSFILQCIYNETYDNSDINIYFEKKVIEQNMINNKYPLGETNETLEYLHKIGSQLMYIESYPIFKKIRSCQYVINDVEIGAIKVTDGNIYDLIRTNFDFLKCAYDGEKLLIYDLESVINKTSTVKIDNNMISHYNRDNFYFEDFLTSYEIKDMIQRHIKRYESRGYTINQNVDISLTSEDENIINQRKESLSWYAMLPYANSTETEIDKQKCIEEAMDYFRKEKYMY